MSEVELPLTFGTLQFDIVPPVIPTVEVDPARCVLEMGLAHFGVNFNPTGPRFVYDEGDGLTVRDRVGGWLKETLDTLLGKYVNFPDAEKPGVTCLGFEFEKPNS